MVFEIIVFLNYFQFDWYKSLTYTMNPFGVNNLKLENK